MGAPVRPRLGQAACVQGGLQQSPAEGATVGGDREARQGQSCATLQFPPSSSGEASVGTSGDQAKPQKGHALGIQTTFQNKSQT